MLLVLGLPIVCWTILPLRQVIERSNKYTRLTMLHLSLWSICRPGFFVIWLFSACQHYKVTKKITRNVVKSIISASAQYFDTKSICSALSSLRSIQRWSVFTWSFIRACVYWVKLYELTSIMADISSMRHKYAHFGTALSVYQDTLILREWELCTALLLHSRK